MTLFDLDSDTTPITVSAANARQLFHGCTTQYIADVCHGRCCRSTVNPRGIVVTIHRNEHAARQAITNLGGAIDSAGLVIPRPGEKACPAQTDGLCSLHNTEAKPFGCIASPFTLNKGNTLIVRNRYRLLICYRDNRDGPALPAYKAFRDSLILILGTTQTDALTTHLDQGGGDYQCHIPTTTYTTLKDNDLAKHSR